MRNRDKWWKTWPVICILLNAGEGRDWEVQSRTRRSLSGEKNRANIDKSERNIPTTWTANIGR